MARSSGSNTPSEAPVSGSQLGAAVHGLWASHVRSFERPSSHLRAVRPRISQRCRLSRGVARGRIDLLLFSQFPAGEREGSAYPGSPLFRVPNTFFVFSLRPPFSRPQWLAILDCATNPASVERPGGSLRRVRAVPVGRAAQLATRGPCGFAGGFPRLRMGRTTRGSLRRLRRGLSGRKNVELARHRT